MDNSIILRLCQFCNLPALLFVEDCIQAVLADHLHGHAGGIQLRRNRKEDDTSALDNLLLQVAGCQHALHKFRRWTIAQLGGNGRSIGGDLGGDQLTWLPSLAA